MLKILITGAGGFIGSRLYLALTNEHDVKGTVRTRSWENNEFIVCDWSKEYNIDFAADVVIHAAAKSPSKKHTFYDYYYNNVVGTQNVIKYAQCHGCKKIIYIGAVSSYGNVDNVLRVNSPHNNPDDYGLTKYIAEKLIINSGMPYEILILPGVVGKGCNSNWITTVASKLKIHGTVQCYNKDGLFNNIVLIDDLADFIKKILEQNLSLSHKYLLGAAELISISEIITLMKDKLCSESIVKWINNKTKPFYLDCNEILKYGYKPTSIKEILNIVCNEI